MAAAITAAYKSQVTYNQPLDLEHRVIAWGMVLCKRYTVDQVLYAIEEHMAKNADMPVPAHIVKILSPEPPRITESMYIEAQKYQRENGYNTYTFQAEILKKYEEQMLREQREHKERLEKVKAIGDMRGQIVDHTA